MKRADFFTRGGSAREAVRSGCGVQAHGGERVGGAAVASPTRSHWRVVLRCLNQDWIEGGGRYIFPAFEFPLLKQAVSEEDVEQHAVDMARDQGYKPVSVVDCELIDDGTDNQGNDFFWTPSDVAFKSR